MVAKKMHMDFLRMPSLLRSGVQVVFGACVLIIAHLIGHRSGIYISKKLGKDEVTGKERVETRLLSNVVYFLFMSAALVIVLHKFGIETSSVLTLLGAAGFALGMALQGALSDIASGVVISVSGMYALGDFIEFSDISGTVVAFNLIFTTLLMKDTMVPITVANRAIYDRMTINHTRLPTRSIVIELPISNRNHDLQHMSEGIRAAVQAHKRVLAQPPVRVAVGPVSHFATVLEVRATIHSEDYPNSQNFSFVAELNSIARQALIDAGGVLAETGDFGHLRLGGSRSS